MKSSILFLTLLGCIAFSNSYSQGLKFNNVNYIASAIRVPQAGLDSPARYNYFTLAKRIKGKTILDNTWGSDSLRTIQQLDSRLGQYTLDTHPEARDQVLSIRFTGSGIPLKDYIQIAGQLGQYHLYWDIDLRSNIIYVYRFPPQG